MALSIITNGPVFTGFKAVLKEGGSPLGADTEECSTSLVRLLQHHHTSASRPGMLLGKVQSGKTRAFVGAIAIAFDSGFDIAVILTKPSKPLAAQTIRRLRHDLSPSVGANQIRIYDAASRIGPLNEWLQNRKLIFVAKKHHKNLENLRDALMGENPALSQKKVLIVDDEVDFASVGYQRRRGTVEMRRVQSLINGLRTDLPNAVYLEVTATPYSLYLQPADLEDPSTGQEVRALRPAFTKCVPVHSGYIGGEVYFDQAREDGAVASFIHVPVPEAELAGLRQAGALDPGTLLVSPDVGSLRRALVTFILAGVLRRDDDRGRPGSERLFSFILHLERSRGAHADEFEIAQRLITQLRSADFFSGSIADEVKASYDDLKASRRAAGMRTPRLSALVPRFGPAFASVSTAVVNSDAQLEQLLDDLGQLRQDSPYNIYIGGQSLDRGVTIANVIGFFYGRDPRVAQQDTTIQHCRMYGNRSPEDVAVTRFYTTAGIYERMSRMNDFDAMLWNQISQREDGGELVDDPGDVVFLERDPTGRVVPCAPSKIVLTQAQWTSPNGELVPRPFSTAKGSTRGRVDEILRQLDELGPASVPFDMKVDEACRLLRSVCSLIRIDEGWDWDLEALGDAVSHLAGQNPDRSLRNRVAGIYTLNNNIRKWRDDLRTDPQRAPYSSTTEQAVRSAAAGCPAVGFYHNRGKIEQGWDGSPFIWPVVFVPGGVTPAVFANNRRKVPRKGRARS